MLVFWINLRFLVDYPQMLTSSVLMVGRSTPPEPRFREIADFECWIRRENNNTGLFKMCWALRTSKASIDRVSGWLLTPNSHRDPCPGSWRSGADFQGEPWYSVHSGMVLVPKMSPKMLLHTGFSVRTCVLNQEHSGKSRALFPFDQPSFRYTRNYVEAT